ncbi:MAG: PAS domain S-box protein [Syntrophobacteraceae bacterium]
MKKLENPNPLSGPSFQAGVPDLLIPSEDSAPEILDLVRFTIDPLLQFRHLGKNFEEITGFAASGFVNFSSSFFNIVYEPDKGPLRVALAKSIDTGSYFSAKFRIVTSAGVKKWLWMRGPAISSGGRHSIQGVISDISPLKEAERNLNAEREFFRAFADTLDDGICIMSSDYVIQFMNRTLIDMVGNHVGEVCYRALFTREGCCSPPVDAEQGEHFESCGFQEHRGLPDSPKIFHVRSLPIATSSGFKGRIGQFRDISKLKKIEHKFRDFAARVRTISRAANMADLGIFMLIDQENIEARFRFANQAFCRITGYNFEELLEMGIADLIHPDDLEAAMDRYRRRLRGEPMGDTYEIQLVRKDQVAITVFFMGALAIHHGKTATVGFVRDITTRKQLQESLFLSQRLASIGKLSAEIAHEINNPLTSVLAFNKLLEKIIQKQPFPVERIPELQDYVRYVNCEAARCAEIARNLLNFSRTTEIRIKENNLHEILDKTLNILRHRAEMNNISIVTSYSPDVPPVHCDFSRIQQALMNILWNAIEAMPDGGTLTVSTSYEARTQCSHLCKSGKNMVQVAISDTGVGIPKENLPRIFEPFFSTKKEKSGVGLGLSVAYGIVRKHNGQIQVQSEPGSGSTFLVQLPSDICTTCPFAEC